jgi:hypothetical protein
MMKIVRTTAAALISGLLMSGVSVPAWSAAPTSEGPTVAQVASADALLQPADGVLAAPELPRFQQIRPEAQNNCKPGRMYSAHDIVGDPQACIMGALAVSTAFTQPRPRDSSALASWSEKHRSMLPSSMIGPEKRSFDKRPRIM